MFVLGLAPTHVQDLRICPAAEARSLRGMNVLIMESCFVERVC